MKKIFVEPNFIQQADDVILYEHHGLVAISVEDETLYDAYMVEISDENILTMENEIKKTLTQNLNTLCDSKSRGVKQLIAQMEVSVEQMEEYALVAKAIDAKDVKWFADEAKLFGSTAKAEFEKAKLAKEGYSLAYNQFKKLIRLFRRFVSQDISLGNFIDVKQMIEAGKTIGVGLEGAPIEILTQSKEQVMNIITTKGAIDGTK